MNDPSPATTPDSEGNQRFLSGTYRQAHDLQATQRLLRATLDSSMDMIQVFEAVRNEQAEIVDFTWILNNHASEKMYGDVLGKSLLQLQPGVVEEGIFAAFKHVVETGQPQQYEKHYVHEQFDGWFFQSIVKLGDGVATTTADITRRKNAEQALQQSKALLQDVIDAPNIGIAVYKALRNNQGEIIDFVHEYINRASLTMLGGEDFTGKLFTDHGENGILQLPQLIDVVETGIGNSYLREAHFRGRQVKFAITNSLLDGDRLVHTWEDVTQRENAKEEIKEQAHFIQRVTQMMPDVVSVVEFPSRTILYTNRDTLTWIGFDANEISSLSFEERIQLFHPDDLSTIQDFYGRFGSMKDHDETTMEYRLKNKQGEWVLLSLRGQVFRRDEQGQPTQLLFVGQNITAQRKAEAEILRLKDEVARTVTDKYRSLFESIDEGFAIVEVFVDQRGCVTDMIYREANPAFERHSGMRDFIGKKVSDVLPHLEQHWLDLLTGIYQTGEPTRTEQHIAELDRWLNLSYSRVGGAGSPLVAIVFNDITERKRTEANLAFLADISQDLAGWTSMETMLNRLGEKIGAYFQLARCVFVEIIESQDKTVIIGDWHLPQLSELPSEFPLSQFVSEEFRRKCRVGEILVVSDVYQSSLVDGRQVEAAFGITSFINVPLLRNGQWRFTLGIYDTTTRDWRADEIELVRELTNRIWTRLEQARAEEALRHSEAQLNAVFEVLPAGLALADASGKILRFNPALNRIWGVPPIPNSTADYVSWKARWVDTGQPLAAEDWAMARTLRTGEVVPGDLVEIEQFDGGRATIINAAAPIRNEAGLIVGGIVAEIDITAQHQAEQALRQSEEKYRLLFESMDEGFYVAEAIFDPTGRCIDIFYLEENPAAVRMIGQSAKGRYMSELAPYEQYWRDLFGETARTGKPQRREEYAAPDDIWYEFYVFKPPQAQANQFALIFQDVTQRRQSQEALQQADRRKDEFLAMLAHELRNPMSTIRSGLQILTLIDGKDQTTRPTVGSDTLTMMSRQTDHLVQMVDDLLDVSRISQGKIELKKERVNLVEVVAQAAESLRALYQEQGRHLQVDLPTTPIEVEGDGARLSQVVTNLLTNGARYTRESGQVWLSLVQQDGRNAPAGNRASPIDRQQALIQVRDNGIGLAADQLWTIFELFVQVDNSLARSKGGLGLGLTLVKRLVEMHGGWVEAHSAGLGKGSTFQVYLPTLNSAAERPSLPIESSLAKAPNQRILVVDDNADAALPLSVLLKLKGYEVHTRHSGQAALEAVEVLKPRVVLMDIGMPVMDGYKTAQLLRQQAWGRAVFLIALTGYGAEADKQRAREAGFNGHLVKPVDLNALTALLTDLLSAG